MAKEYIKVQKVFAEQFDGTQNTMFGHAVVSSDNSVYHMVTSTIGLPDYSELADTIYFGVGDWLVKYDHMIEVVHPESFNEDYYPTK